MTKKKTTWDNLFDFESDDHPSKTVKDDKSDALPYGHVATVGDSGARFLIVDDSSDVIRNHIANFKLQVELAEATDAEFTVALWHAHKSEEGGFKAFVAWLADQDPYDAVFLDADLKMDKETGFDLANLIHENDSLRYQPLCILTAQYTNQKQKAIENPHIKLLLKFEKHQDHNHASTQMFAALPELQDAMRRKFWADCHDQIVIALEQKNATAKSVATRLGSYLTKYHKVNGWYLRARDGGRLCAIAMDDKYEGNDCLLLAKLPGFLRDILSNSSSETATPRARTLIVNDLPLEECGAFSVLENKHALAVVMRADGDDLTGLFSVYRDSDSPKFNDDDARQLQQLVVHIQTLMVSEAKQTFQNDLLKAIDAAREAENVEEMSSNVLPFLHKTINPRRFDDEYCKSSFRVYEAGTGNLKRVGELLGNCTELEDGSGPLINVTNDESTIAEAVRERRSIRYDNVLKQGGKSLKTAKQDLPASLVVPLSYDGAVLGALNFESSVPGKFDAYSEALGEQFAGLLASILFRRRSESFLRSFSDLSADLISGNYSKTIDTANVVQICMSMLYDFCRFSNALFVEVSDLNNIEDIDGWAVRSWSSEGVKSPKDFFAQSLDPSERTEAWRKALRKAGKSSFLYQSLKASDGESTYFTDNVAAIPQVELDVGIRPKGQSTLSQMVIKVFSPRGTLVALCLLFESPAPFTRGYRAIVERFAEFISYLNSSRFISSAHPYGRLEEYETQLFAMYVTLMHSQKKIVSGIVRELEMISEENISFELGLDRIKKKAHLTQMNSDVAKSILNKEEEIKRFSLSQLWRDLIDSYQVFADDLGSELIHLDAEIFFECPRSRLKTILSILIGNSIEHGGGNCKISLSQEDDGSLVYSDTGRGIPPEIGERIFGHFSSSGTGSGTGLIIARLLAEKAGLSITLAEPLNDVGASFEIRKKEAKT